MNKLQTTTAERIPASALPDGAVAPSNQPAPDGPVASVVVCTRNRSASLQRTLEAIGRMSCPTGLAWEVVVVDNGSTDDTRDVAQEFASASPVPVRYLFDGRRGKSNSLNTGITHSRGAVLAFTDDDCLPEASWLANLVGIFAANPDLAILGGRVELYDSRDKAISVIRCERETEIPPERVFEALFGSIKTQDSCGSVIGANMAVRRTTFAKIGLFDLFLAPGAMKKSAGSEDSDLVYRASRSGLKIMYSPAPFVYHNHGRRTDADLESVVHSYTRGRGAFYFKHVLAGDIRVAKQAFWEVKAYCKELVSSRRIDPEKRKVIWRVLQDLFSGMATQIAVVGKSRVGRMDALGS